MTTPWQVEWFTVPSGPHAGQRRISGWSMTAVATYPAGTGTLRLGTCPVCFDLVPAGGGPGTLDLTHRHDQWHAANDFPDPENGGIAQLRPVRRVLEMADAAMAGEGITPAVRQRVIRTVLYGTPDPDAIRETARLDPPAEAGP